MKKLILLVVVVLCYGCNSSTNSSVNSSSSEPVNSSLEVLNRGWAIYKFTDSEVENYSGMIEQTLVDYISQFPNYSKNQVDSSLTQLVLQTESNVVFFNFLKDKFTNYLYHANSPYRNDLYFEQVLNAYSSSGKLSDGDKARNQIVLELIKKNQVGTQAADFSFVDKQGVKHQLTDVKSDYKLVVFYDPLCVNCQSLIHEMRDSEVLNKGILSGKVQVVAIDPLGDYATWKSYQSEIPDGWINGLDDTGDIQKKPLYNILAYPTIYLLGANNSVLLKDVYLPTVEEFLAE